MKNSVLFIGAIATAFASLNVQAASEDWYVGGGVGIARIKFNNDDFSYSDPTITESKDRRSTGYKGFIGYRITPNFGVELAYVDFGSFKYGYVNSPDGMAKDDVKASGINLSLVGTYPIHDKFLALGKIGAINVRTKSNFQSDAAFQSLVGDASGSGSANQIRLSAGIGLMYKLNDRLSVRGEYEYFHEVGNGSSGRLKPELVSISAVYRF